MISFLLKEKINIFIIKVNFSNSQTYFVVFDIDSNIVKLFNILLFILFRAIYFLAD